MHDLNTLLLVGWKTMAATGNRRWVERVSREFEHNVTADELRLALEADLDTGILAVTRSNIEER